MADTPDIELVEMAVPSRQARRPARLIRIIGIGSGDPAHLTEAANAALKSVAYVVAAAKREDDPLLDIRRRLCDAADVPLVAVPDPERDRQDPADYPAAVRDWHDARVEAYATTIEQNPGDVGFLVWGDPSLYDSTLRIVERLAERLDATYDVVPGLSAPTLLAAAHRFVLHRVGEPVLVTTGRRLAEDAEQHGNLVVMLDGSLTCLDLPDQERWHIWWGANLGTETERLVSGRLDQVGGELREAREKAKAEAGWVMDIYLLRATGTQVP